MPYPINQRAHQFNSIQSVPVSFGLWDTALKFLSPGPRSGVTDHLGAEEHLETVPAINDYCAYIFFASQGGCARNVRNAQHAGHVDWFKALGTLRFNDATATRTSKKTIGLIKQNNSFARASHFFVHFFHVFVRLLRENA